MVICVSGTNKYSETGKTRKSKFTAIQSAAEVQY